MRQLVLVAGIVALCSGAGSAQPLDMKMFGWLAGTWEMTAGQQMIEEHWTTPTANAMIGMGRTVSGDRTSEFEFLRIEKRGGDLFYVPQPGGRPPVAFKLTSSAGGRFIFENNTSEDRVKSVEYRREGDDGLYARIEGAQDGKPFLLEFRYRRRK
jgi:hypothetical protein